MALRIARGYRTIALEAALALAGTPPWEIEAEARAEMQFPCKSRRRWRRPTGAKKSDARQGPGSATRLREMGGFSRRSYEGDARRRVPPLLQEWAERR